MLPQLLMQYKQIVDNYLDEQWGIYDNSSDLYRAIAISDAYFGDQGSVAWLYHKTGKPILIQDVNL